MRVAFGAFSPCIIFCGEGEPFLRFAMEVELRRKVADSDERKGASALVLQTEPAARDVRMAVGSGRPVGPDGAHVILRASRDFLAPGPLDTDCQDALRSLHFKTATQNVGEYLVESDLVAPGGRGLYTAWGRFVRQLS